jgi:hypothetical protein
VTKISDNDPDKAKGATEDELPNHEQNAGLANQLGHRDQDPLLKDSDSDFPEPGASPEHSGEPREAASNESNSKTSKPKIA